jgi:hypothetical protein
LFYRANKAFSVAYLSQHGNGRSAASSRIEEQQFGRSLVLIIATASGDTEQFGVAQPTCRCRAVVEFGDLIRLHVGID